MTAPSLATTADARLHTRQILRFGNNTYPIVGGTQAFVDLNDGVSWFAQGIQMPTARKLGLLPYAWRAKSAYISDDYDAMVVKVQMQYDETAGTSFQSVKGQLLAMGEQYLTLDNSTQVLAKIAGFGTPSVIGGQVTPYLWAFDIDFVCKEPWLSDITATTTSLASGSNSISYAGGIFCEPIYTLTSTSTTLVINNSTAGQSLTVLGLPGSGSVVVNTQDWTAKIGSTQYDVSGSFPFLFPGPTSPQTNTVSITNGSGSVTYSSRWAL